MVDEDGDEHHNAVSPHNEKRAGVRRGQKDSL
jgi:hypothetical protein